MIKKLFRHILKIIPIAFAYFGGIWLLIEPLGLFGVSAKLSDFGIKGYILLLSSSLLLGTVTYLVRRAVSIRKLNSKSLASSHKEQKQISKIDTLVEFAVVGELVIGRRQHISIQLQNGKVLIAGGVDKHEEILASAEIFDLTSKTFTHVGRMIERRYRSTATLLPDNRILITGGQGETGALNSAEMYLPSGKFISLGCREDLRNGHDATLLKDGRVLISGGMGQIHSAELFDPAREVFVNAGEMAMPRSTEHTSNAVLLTNGKVLIAGGYGYGIGSIDVAEIYDPDIGTFGVTGNMTVKRACHTLTLLQNGKVLVAGGATDINDGSTVHLTSAEIYDPITAKFTLTQNSMAAPHFLHTANLLPNGRVIIIGGYSPLVEVYDPITNNFSPFGQLTKSRNLHTTIILPIDRDKYQILVIGGAGESSATVELSPILEL
jgi:hypothetical protein